MVWVISIVIRQGHGVTKAMMLTIMTSIRIDMIRSNVSIRIVGQSNKDNSAGWWHDGIDVVSSIRQTP